MATTLKLEIVTPEAKIYSEDVDTVTPPGSRRGAGHLPDAHSADDPVDGGGGVCRKGRNKIISRRGRRVSCRSRGERVAILTDMAIKADDIDETKAEEARKRAEARLQDKLGGEEQATVQAALLHSLTQLNVKRRRR